ncbi:MAG: hypothetical protein HFJ64_02610 [Eggerthellaceae bacterium]|nr:hypothetical protein [Eggerthellaceae bacterium]
MQDYAFTDALTGSIIEFNYDMGNVSLTKGSQIPQGHKSIFFPGCSFLNYAMPLVSAVNETLLQHEVVDGISILCCGKILSYEEGGDVLREAFEEQMREHVHAAGIEKIVCACPNCVKALREAFADDERTSHVELAVLPQVLSDIGYKVDKRVAATLLKADADADVLLSVHDSCPDRAYGDFARGLRAILPEGIWADPEHSWKKSVCCGSLPRAAGKIEQADKCARINVNEAEEMNADAIVTACMSCAFQLNMVNLGIPAIHFLELLYNWRIDWSRVGMWMKLRFLFDESMGAIEKPSGRSYMGVEETFASPSTSETAYVDDSDVVVGEKIVDIDVSEAKDKHRDVATSECDVIEIGE